eukprot:CAMPEP_0181421680 /NCGR_PEP_ID=MMETSP1110-20121109/13222_1 /TAXON_ID=174948 /ORGANISM="Symbiodinium sp., Strain CCMP421" /LENGTH=282 /DNA_ID=CAMNT_0023544751 /DNA_START=66 /DNA_END=914 /DNA_ORIENTATION=+
MSLLSTMPASPRKLARRGSETTVAPELSDSESVKGCSSGFPSPRLDTPEWGVDGQCKVFVKATFLDVDESQGLMQCFAQLRGRTMSDSAAVIAFDIEEAYMPGKFSEEHTSDCIAKPTTVCAKVPATHPKSKVQKRSNPAKQLSDRTTVMLRNIPNNYTREMFLALLDDNGFAGRYDFVYLPCDFRRQANLGYAFVNLVDACAVDAAWATFDGFADWALPTQKVCQVKWSGPHQGLEAHVDRYKNSPVMHKRVPDHYKPVVFHGGVRKPFPRPTKKIKAPSL